MRNDGNFILLPGLQLLPVRRRRSKRQSIRSTERNYGILNMLPRRAIKIASRNASRGNLQNLFISGIFEVICGAVVIVVVAPNRGSRRRKAVRGASVLVRMAGCRNSYRCGSHHHKTDCLEARGLVCIVTTYALCKDGADASLKSAK